MRRILVIQNKRIGDVILTAPVLDVLRSIFPKAKLSLAMDSACHGVEALLPEIEPLYFYKRRFNFHFCVWSSQERIAVYWLQGFPWRGFVRPMSGTGSQQAAAWPLTDLLNQMSKIGTPWITIWIS
jgi:hypothetical protein